MKKTLLFALGIAITSFVSAQSAPKGLQVGEHAPGFHATDQTGKVITLQEVLKKGPVVLVFYRGEWCPYCNRYLSKLEDSLSLIAAQKATVLAVTPEKPENIAKTIDKTKSSFSILYDKGLNIMKQYDVAYEVAQDVVAKYKSYGIDFHEANGKNGNVLPVPAVYIISTDGRITYRYFDADYTRRASVKEILEHL